MRIKTNANMLLISGTQDPGSLNGMGAWSHVMCYGWDFPSAILRFHRVSNMIPVDLIEKRLKTNKSCLWGWKKIQRWDTKGVHISIQFS